LLRKIKSTAGSASKMVERRQPLMCNIPRGKQAKETTMNSVPFSTVEESIMQNALVTDIVRLRRSRFALQSWRQLGRLALTLAVGLPVIMLVFHLLDPDAPLAYIVVPVLAGGLLPLFISPPGRFEITTLADTSQLAEELDTRFTELGYRNVHKASGAMRYRARKQAWLGWQGRQFEVTVRGQSLDVTGPVAILQALQRHIAPYLVPPSARGQQAAG
jgi:hypothetical protein